MPLPLKVTNRHPRLPIHNESRRGPIAESRRGINVIYALAAVLSTQSEGFASHTDEVFIGEDARL